MNDYKKEIEIFNQESKIWDSKQTDVSKEINRLCDLCNIKQGDKILDVGCGTGILESELINRVGDTGFVKAIDISSGMIDVAKSKFDFENLNFLVDNIETIKDEENFYDLIICNNVFPHFINLDKVLTNSFRLLKENGLFVVSHLKGREFVNNIHKNTNHFQEDKVPKPQVWIDIFKKFGFKEILNLDEKDFYIIIMNKNIL